MTPEREAQMREMFEKHWLQEAGPCDGGYWFVRSKSKPDEYEFSEMQQDWESWLACASALEQFAVDAYDLGWLSCVEWSDRDDLAADMQSPAYLDLRRLRLKALAEKPNAAMSAALEEEKNANQ